MAYPLIRSMMSVDYFIVYDGVETVRVVWSHPLRYTMNDIVRWWNHGHYDFHGVGNAVVNDHGVAHQVFIDRNGTMTKCDVISQLCN
uniref:Uncharacterized protein n=1 Tax=viral metagenome TaxID=1070528 RepID=A0A6C0LXN1_9ZZZZ